MENVDYMFHLMENSRQESINDFILSFNFFKCKVFLMDEDVQNAFYYYNRDSEKSCDEVAKKNLINFLCINFKNINAMINNNWTYEENGLFTEEKSLFYSSFIKQLETMIFRNPLIGFEFIVYNGVNFQNFNRCGIKNFDELTNLKGSFLRDKGFVNCFLIKGYENLSNNYQIKLEIKVSGSYSDGIVLGNRFLINANSVIYVTDVLLDDTLKTAIIKAVLIPNLLLKRSFIENSEISL